MLNNLVRKLDETSSTDLSAIAVVLALREHVRTFFSLERILLVILAQERHC